MRFDSLKLKAFGHFTDYPLDFDPTKNFHLLYGPNEAGKSTTLRSITDFLYGFQQKTNDAFLHGNGNLRIEGQLRNSNGEVLTFTRRKGRKNTVLDLNENPMNEKVVDEFLHSLPESQLQFKSMFALNHETLREGGETLLQSGGSAGEGLFSAASGINILRKIMDNLNKETGNLYKKTGSNPKLNKLLQQEKELNKKLSENQLKIQSWKELERQYNEGKKEIDELINHIKKLRQKQKKLERIKQMLPKISKRRDLLQKIAELEVIPNLPDDVKEIRTSAEAGLNAARKDKEKLEREIETIQSGLGKLSIPEKILEQATIIDTLYREVQTYQNNVNKIPELEGKRSQFKGQVISIMKEIDSAHADLNNVDMFRLSAEKKETIRERIKQKPLLDQNLTNLMDESKKSKRELEKKTEELANMPELPSLDELEAVIDKVKRVDSIEENIDKLEKDCIQKERDIAEEISRLPLWTESREEFSAFTVPVLSETIKKHEKEQNDLLQELQKIREQIKLKEENIEQYEESIRRLDSFAEIPSVEKLLNLRETRDEGWKIIRKKLQTGNWDENLESYTNGQDIEVVYEKQVQEADQIVDTMRIEAEKVGEKNKLLFDIETGKRKIAELQQEESRWLDELNSWENTWHELWKLTGITPLTPAEMKEWLEKYTSIKDEIQAYETSLNELHEIQRKKDHLKAELIQVLNTFGTISNDKSLNELLNIAEKQLKEIRNLSIAHTNLETSIRELKQKIRDYDNEIKDQNATIDSWNSQWTQAIQNTNISADTPTTVAEKMLLQYENCAQDYDFLLNIEKEQQAIQEQIELFDKKVDELLQTVELSLDETNPAFVVNKLHTLLQKAKEDQIAWNNLNQHHNKLQSDLQEAIDNLNESQAILDNLFKLAGCQNLEELKEAENKFMVKKEHLQKLQNVEEEMLNQGNGKSIQELIGEANHYDSDQIDGELVALEHELELFEAKRSELEQAYGVVKKDYEDKVQGQTIVSVQVEQEKNSVHAQIASLMEQYVQLKLASILLQKGIEDYRNRNQDPIITKAGEIFRKLTLESFIDLTIDYDEKDEPIIMGVRNSGEKVAIEGMSDGTTDQLYLSLRIATMEKNAKESEPIPFIVDDILVHFDDNRSKETLRVLLELSKHTQIIFFTHHSRLIEIIQEIADEKVYQVIEINHDKAVLNY